MPRRGGIKSGSGVPPLFSRSEEAGRLFHFIGKFPLPTCPILQRRGRAQARLGPVPPGRIDTQLGPSGSPPRRAAVPFGARADCMLPIAARARPGAPPPSSCIRETNRDWPAAVALGMPPRPPGGTAEPTEGERAPDNAEAAIGWRRRRREAQREQRPRQRRCFPPEPPVPDWASFPPPERGLWRPQIVRLRMRPERTRREYKRPRSCGPSPSRRLPARRRRDKATWGTALWRAAATASGLTPPLKILLFTMGAAVEEDAFLGQGGGQGGGGHAAPQVATGQIAGVDEGVSRRRQAECGIGTSRRGGC